MRLGLFLLATIADLDGFSVFQETHVRPTVVFDVVLYFFFYKGKTP